MGSSLLKLELKTKLLVAFVLALFGVAVAEPGYGYSSYSRGYGGYRGGYGGGYGGGYSSGGYGAHGHYGKREAEAAAEPGYGSYGYGGYGHGGYSGYSSRGY